MAEDNYAWIESIFKKGTVISMQLSTKPCRCCEEPEQPPCTCIEWPVLWTRSGPGAEYFYKNSQQTVRITLDQDIDWETCVGEIDNEVMVVNVVGKIEDDKGNSREGELEFNITKDHKFYVCGLEEEPEDPLDYAIYVDWKVV